MDQLGSKVHLPLVVCLIESRLGPHVDCLYIVLGQQSRNCNIKKVQLPEDVCDIKLVGDRVSPIIKLLRLRPVRLATESVEEELDIRGDEVEQVEGF